MNLTTLETQVYRDLRQSTTSSRVTTARVDEALNDAYVEVCRATECLTRESTVSESGATSDPIELPADCCRVLNVWLPAFAQRLSEATMHDLTRINRNWRAVAKGTPEYWYYAVGIDSATNTPATKLAIQFYPFATTIAVNYPVEFACIPIASPVTGQFGILTGSGSPAFAAAYHPILVHGAVMRLAGEFLGDMEGSDKIVALAASEYQRLLAEMKGIAP